MPSPRPEFVLDPRLSADTHVVGNLELSRVLLMDDARFPWLILVPRRPGMRDWIDLSAPDQHRLLDEVGTCSRMLRGLYSPDKLNIASLGNMVGQLHVHVVARFQGDAAWPRPVWGVGTVERRTPQDTAQMLTSLKRALAGEPP